MKYKIRELVYGNSLEALIYAYLHNLYVVYEGSKLYNDFDFIYEEAMFVNLKFLVSEKKLNTSDGEKVFYAQKQYLCDFLCFHLSLAGKVLNHQQVDSARIKDNTLNFICGNKKDWVEFEKIYLFENNKLQSYNKPLKTYYTFDYFNYYGKNPYDIIFTSGTLAQQICNVSSSQLMSFSKINEKDLYDDDYSLVSIRYKIQDEIRGRKHLLRYCKFTHRDVQRKHLHFSNREDVTPVLETVEEICQAYFTRKKQKNIESPDASLLKMMRLHLGMNGTIASPLLKKIIQQSKMQYSIVPRLGVTVSGSQWKTRGRLLSKKG